MTSALLRQPNGLIFKTHVQPNGLVRLIHDNLVFAYVHSALPFIRVLYHFHGL